MDRFSTAPLGGIPDGMALDAEGYLWVAMYEAGCIGRFAPSGELVARLEVPARLVTSVCFAGPDSPDLFFVSADHSERPELRGCVFRTDVGVAGAPVGVATV